MRFAIWIYFYYIVSVSIFFILYLGEVMFKKRIGSDPHLNGEGTSGAKGCPDIWELDSGEFAIIGIRRTSELKDNLPVSASCGPDEEIVILPRKILVNARNSIPKK